MSTRQRLTASLFLAAAALFFLCPNWSAMAISSRGGDMTAWLTPRSIGLQVLAGTMLLGGLWHGAAWNYVLWGAYQGALLCGHRFLMHGRETLPTSGDPVTGTTDIHGGALRTPILFPRWISTPLRIIVMVFIMRDGATNF